MSTPHETTPPRDDEGPDTGAVDELMATIVGADLPTEDPHAVEDVDLTVRPVGPDALPPGWRAPVRGRIAVLRMGHRPRRDKRITTHVCLSARALGADAVYLHGPDLRIERGVKAVVDRFGGPFHVQAVDSWRRVLRTWKDAGATVAHLTMYGVPVDEAARRLAEAEVAGGGPDTVDPAPPAPAAPPLSDEAPREGPSDGPERRPSPPDLLVVIGAEKVPPEVYETADLNVAVGSQPHSEVAALAIFLDRVTKGSWPLRTYKGQVKVCPSEKGKSISPTKTE